MEGDTLRLDDDTREFLKTLMVQSASTAFDRAWEAIKEAKPGESHFEIFQREFASSFIAACARVGMPVARPEDQ
jgi:hypothetical protein